MKPGWIVILNGPPRSGKSSIVDVIQETFEGPWMNLGVDTFVQRVTPPKYRPGVGLRPGNDRPELRPLVATFFAAMYDSMAAHSRLGLNVVADMGHYDLPMLVACARRVKDLPVLIVGVKCPIEEIMRRRNESGGTYLGGSPEAPPEPVVRWQEGTKQILVDVEVDTSKLSPEECARFIWRRLTEGPPPLAIRALAESAD